MAKPPKNVPPAAPPGPPGQAAPRDAGSSGSTNPWHPLSATIRGKAAARLGKALHEVKPGRGADDTASEDRRPEGGGEEKK